MFTAQWFAGPPRSVPAPQSVARERRGETLGLLRPLGLVRDDLGAARRRQRPLRLHHREGIPGGEALARLLPPSRGIGDRMPQGWHPTQRYQGREHSCGHENPQIEAHRLWIRCLSQGVHVHGF